MGSVPQRVATIPNDEGRRPSGQKGRKDESGRGNEEIGRRERDSCRRTDSIPDADD